MSYKRHPDWIIKLLAIGLASSLIFYLLRQLFAFLKTFLHF